MAFYTHIEKETLNNNNFRKVIYTGNMQLVLMSLKPLEEIGSEIHHNVEQFFRIEQGNGIAEVNIDNKTKKYILKDGDVIIIPKNTYHNIKNTSNTNDLKLYTLYSPPNHPPNRIDKTKPRENKTLKYKLIK